MLSGLPENFRHSHLTVSRKVLIERVTIHFYWFNQHFPAPFAWAYTGVPAGINKQADSVLRTRFLVLFPELF